MRSDRAASYVTCIGEAQRQTVQDFGEEQYLRLKHSHSSDLHVIVQRVVDPIRISDIAGVALRIFQA
jgi:hypothetical protein